MQTLQNVTNFAIFLILVNAMFFIYLLIVSKHTFSDRNILKETNAIMNELVDMYQDIETRDEENLAREMIADIEDHLNRLY